MKIDINSDFLTRMDCIANADYLILDKKEKVKVVKALPFYFEKLKELFGFSDKANPKKIEMALVGELTTNQNLVTSEKDLARITAVVNKYLNPNGAKLLAKGERYQEVAALIQSITENIQEKARSSPEKKELSNSLRSNGIIDKFDGEAEGNQKIINTVNSVLRASSSESETTQGKRQSSLVTTSLGPLTFSPITPITPITSQSSKSDSPLEVDKGRPYVSSTTIQPEFDYKELLAAQQIIKNNLSDNAKNHYDFYKPVANAKMAGERFDEVVGELVNVSYELTTNPKTNNFQVRFVANSQKDLNEIKQNIFYQHALRGMGLPNFDSPGQSWRTQGAKEGEFALTLSSNETFTILGFHTKKEDTKFDDIMYDLDGIMLKEQDFNDLPSFEFRTKFEPGEYMYQAEYNLEEICKKCEVKSSIVQNIQPSGEILYQAQFHCKNALSQKKLKAALALVLKEKNVYNKVEFDMKWREIALMPEDHVFTLTSDETFTLLGYGISNAEERGGAGKKIEKQFEDDMSEARFSQNWRKNNLLVESQKVSTFNKNQVLQRFKKIAQIANCESFTVNKGEILFKCVSASDAYRLRNMVVDQITNNGYHLNKEDLKLFIEKLEITQISLEEYGLRLSPEVAQEFIYFKGVEITSSLKDYQNMLSQWEIYPIEDSVAKKELDLKKLVEKAGATSYSIVRYRKGPGKYSYSVKFIFDNINNIKKLKNEAKIKLKDQSGKELNGDGFLQPEFGLGKKYSLMLTANQMFNQLGFKSDDEYDRFVQEVDGKLKAGAARETTELVGAEDLKIISQFMLVRNEYYGMRHVGHVSNGSGHSEVVYVACKKSLLAAGPRSFNRMVVEAETLRLVGTKPAYCAAIYTKTEANPRDNQYYVPMGFLTENGTFLITSKDLPLEERVRIAVMEDVINYLVKEEEPTIGGADMAIYSISQNQFAKGLKAVKQLHLKHKIDYNKLLK